MVRRQKGRFKPSKSSCYWDSSMVRWTPFLQGQMYMVHGHLHHPHICHHHTSSRCPCGKLVNPRDLSVNKGSNGHTAPLQEGVEGQGVGQQVADRPVPRSVVNQGAGNGIHGHHQQEEEPPGLWCLAWETESLLTTLQSTCLHSHLQGTGQPQYRSDRPHLLLVVPTEDHNAVLNFPERHFLSFPALGWALYPGQYPRSGGLHPPPQLALLSPCPQQ